MIFRFYMGTRLEAYIHSLNSPKTDLPVVDSPNISFEDVKSCQKGLWHFVILATSTLHRPTLISELTPLTSVKRE